MAVSPQAPVVAVTVNHATQASVNCCSSALVTLLADLPRADIAAATSAVTAAAEEDNDTETDDRTGSPLSVRARTPAQLGGKLPALPSTGKSNVWLSVWRRSRTVAQA